MTNSLCLTVFLILWFSLHDTSIISKKHFVHVQRVSITHQRLCQHAIKFKYFSNLMQNKNNADGMPDRPMRLYCASARAPCECVCVCCVWLKSEHVLCTVGTLRVCVCCYYHCCCCRYTGIYCSCGYGNLGVQWQPTIKLRRMVEFCTWQWGIQLYNVSVRRWYSFKIYLLVL